MEKKDKINNNDLENARKVLAMLNYAYEENETEGLDKDILRKLVNECSKVVFGPRYPELYYATHRIIENYSSILTKMDEIFGDDSKPKLGEEEKPFISTLGQILEILDPLITKSGK